jgi:hypothetical protein
LWPFFCRRRTMLAPILPNPIIPSCIVLRSSAFREVEIPCDSKQLLLALL